MTASTPQTIDHWLHWIEQQLQAADLFYGHGMDNAWDEAVQLVLFVMDLPIDSGEEILTNTVNPSQAQHIQDLVKQRTQQRIPLAYLTQTAWFVGMPFYVDERVLIPRSPFGEWIERQFQPWIEAAQVQQILEIGTGSACMAIAAALAFPTAQVDAVDISEQALAVAKINVDRYQLAERVNLLQSDCFSAVPSRQYDIIMANPPYVGAAEMAGLPAEYRHEPNGALQAADDGLAIAIRILREAHRYLTPHGILLLEVGNSDMLLAKRFPEVPFIWLEQAFGGHGLLLLTADLLAQYQSFF